MALDAYMKAYFAHKQELINMITNEAGKNSCLGFGATLIETVDGPIQNGTVIAASMGSDGTWFCPTGLQEDTETEPQS